MAYSDGYRERSLPAWLVHHDCAALEARERAILEAGGCWINLGNYWRGQNDWRRNPDAGGYARPVGRRAA